MKRNYTRENNSCLCSRPNHIDWTMTTMEMYNYCVNSVAARESKKVRKR